MESVRNSKNDNLLVCRESGSRRTAAISVRIGALFAAVVCFVLMGALIVPADPLPVLSDGKFQAKMIEMTGEYDTDATPEQAARDPYITQRLIVKSESHYLDPEEYGAIDAIQSRDGTYLLQFESSAAARKAENEIAKEESTVYVEPDSLLFADSEGGTDSVSSAEELNSMLYAAAAQWNIEMMMLDRYASYIKEKGENKEIIVAVLDTGISFTHSLLKGRILTDKAKSYVADYDSADEQKNPSTSKISPHGTHVAGIIAQSTPDLNVRILPIRVLSSDTNTGTDTSVSSGIDYAIQQGAKIINLSLSGQDTSANQDISNTLHNSIKKAVSAGILVVVSSGNSINGGTNAVDITNNRVIPASFPECVVVGSTNQNKVKAESSNYGTTLDIVAPGVEIWSSKVNEKKEDVYGKMTGTSMSAPHVSGEAAMLLMTNSGKSPAQIESMIQSNAIDLGAAGRDDYYGYGLASLENLLKFTVTYAPGAHGTFKETTTTALYGSATPAEPTVTGEKGYSFDGWSPSRSTTVRGNITYVALWKKTGKTQAEEDAEKKAKEEAERRAKEEENTRKRAEEQAVSQSISAPAVDAAAQAAAQQAAQAAAAQAAAQQAAQEAAQYQASDPHPNVSYQVPMKTNQKTGTLSVPGLEGADRVVSWTSSNSKTATVSGNPDGTCLVKAGKKSGTAVITATCASGKTVTFHIKVQKKKVSTKSIHIASGNVTLKVGQTLQLEPEIYPITSTDKVKYSSKKKSVVTVTGNGVLTGRSKGTAVVEIKSGKKKVKLNVTVQ